MDCVLKYHYNVAKCQPYQLPTHFQNLPIYLPITRHCMTREYLLTPGSRALLEKPTGFQLVKKFPTFYETRRFITAFTSSRHLSISWDRSIQSIPPHPNSWRSILILSSHLRLCIPCGLFPSGFPNKILHTPLLYPHTCCMIRPSHSWLDHPNNIGWAVHIIKLIIM